MNANRLLASVVMCHFLILASTSFAADEKTTSVDVSQFDVSGIKIGMGFEETLSSLKNKYKPNPKDITVMNERLLDNVTRDDNPPKSIYLHTPNEQISVEVMRTFPPIPQRKYAVYSIEYKLKNVADKKEAQSKLMASALSKYGTPSYSATSTSEWCKTPKVIGSSACATGADKDQDYLEVDGNYLTVKLVGKNFISQQNQAQKAAQPKSTVNF